MYVMTRKGENSHAGQVVVLVLLMGLMGLTVGLSVASRSLADLKQVSNVDSGTKAFAGAEAGLQYGLTVLNSGQLSTSGSIPTNDLPSGFTSITYTIAPNTDNAMSYFSAINSNDVIQLDLSTVTASTSGADILWSNPDAAMEIIVVDSNNRLTRYIYNPQYTGLNPNPTFTNSNPAAGCVNVNCTVSAAFAASGRCTAPDATGLWSIPVQSSVGAYKLMRVKPLINGTGTTDIAVCGRTTDRTPPDLGGINYTVTAVATTTNNTQKKLQVLKFPPALPSLFDYVIFSRGAVSKP